MYIECQTLAGYSLNTKDNNRELSEGYYVCEIFWKQKMWGEMRFRLHLCRIDMIKAFDRVDLFCWFFKAFDKIRGMQVSIEGDWFEAGR